MTLVFNSVEERFLAGKKWSVSSMTQAKALKSVSTYRASGRRGWRQQWRTRSWSWLTAPVEDKLVMGFHSVPNNFSLPPTSTRARLRVPLFSQFGRWNRAESTLGDGGRYKSTLKMSVNKSAASRKRKRDDGSSQPSTFQLSTDTPAKVGPLLGV